MKDQPLFLSILLGIIVVLVIGGVSLSVKVNYMSRNYKQLLAENMELQKENQDLRKNELDFSRNISELEKTVESQNERESELIKQNEALSLELEKTTRLKDKLEEGLKEELMKNAQK